MSENKKDTLSLKKVKSKLEKNNMDLWSNISNIEDSIKEISEYCYKIRDKIWSSETKNEENVIWYITNIENSNKKINDILEKDYKEESFYNKHPFFNWTYYKTFEWIFSLILYFLPALLIILFGFILYFLPDNEFRKLFISLYTVFIDKYYLLFCSIMIWFSFSRYYELLVNHDYNEKLVKKSRKYLLWIIFWFYFFYLSIWILAYFIFSEYSKLI